jgi:hypothetical protein
LGKLSDDRVEMVFAVTICKIRCLNEEGLVVAYNLHDYQYTSPTWVIVKRERINTESDFGNIFLGQCLAIILPSDVVGIGSNNNALIINDNTLGAFESQTDEALR